MKEENQTVSIRLSSFASSFEPAHFPVASLLPGGKAEFLSVKTAEDMIARLMERKASHFHLHNPTESVLDLCMEKSSTFTISFDRIPPRKVFPLLKPYVVQVPSLSFHTIFRQNGIKAKVVHPLPREQIRQSAGRKEARQTLRVGDRLCVWVDENLVPPSFRFALFQALQSALKDDPRFKTIWVTKRISFAKNHMVSLNPDVARGKALWLAADLLLTVGGFSQSFAPLHIQSLYQRIPVMTDRAGDHGEWVNHLYSGILIDKKNISKELRHYFHRLARDRGLLEQFRLNGHRLVQKIIGAKWDGSEKTDSQYHYSDKR
ncbi:MAG: hypothetical protein WBZ33_08035 [Thermoactinomyces sp.]